jgi:predicted nucleotidyltransferase
MRTTANAVQWREYTLAEARARRQDALQKFTQSVIENVQPACIILFGSSAKGMDQVGSDLDLVIVGGKLPRSMLERLRHIGRLKWDLPVSIDAFPYTEAEFEQMLDNLHVTALDCMYEGVPLYGQNYFERLRPKFNAYVARGLRKGKAAWYFDKKSS